MLAIEATFVVLTFALSGGLLVWVVCAGVRGWLWRRHLSRSHIPRAALDPSSRTSQFKSNTYSMRDFK